MAQFRDVYEFAAKAGSLEGYVYPKDMDQTYLLPWTENLVNLYNTLPPAVQQEIQAGCNETLGRTIQALLPVLGEGHEVIRKLRALVKGKLPSSPDDFPHHRRG
jgi:hypothetical protein